MIMDGRGHPFIMRKKKESMHEPTRNIRDYEEKSVNMIFYDKNGR